MTDQEAPLLPGPLYGLRTWTIEQRRKGDRLAGPYQETVWPAGRVTEARCEGSGHQAPHPKCSCGLYGWHPTPQTARRVLAQASRDHGTVAGIVAAWGAVDVHADGFRAQQATPHALVLPRHASPAVAQRIHALADAYGAQVLEVGPAELVGHCRAFHLGLHGQALEQLIARTVRSDRRAVRRRRAQIAAARGVAVAGVLAAVIGVIQAWPSIEASLSTPPPRVPPEVGRLTMVEEHVVENEDATAAYLAVVRNDHPTKAALGVFVAGSLRDRDGELLARLGSRLDVEHRPMLAAGTSGVVVDVLDDDGGLQARVARFRTSALARVFRPGARAAPVRLSSVRFERRRCLVTARVRSDRRRLSASVVVIAYDRRGRFDWGSFVDVGPLPAGSSVQVLHRAEPGNCAPPPARVAAFPDLSVEQVVRR